MKVKQIDDFKQNLKNSGSNDLVLPVFDQINVKAFQLMRPQTSNIIAQPNLSLTLSDEFGFIFSNNQLLDLKIPSSYQDQGLIIVDLKQAVEQYSDLFMTYFSKLIRPREDLITYEHYCRLTGGVFVYVPDGMKIEQTLQAYFDFEPNGHSNHVVVVLGKGSKFSIAENQVSKDVGQGNYSNFFEIYAKDHSKLSYVINDQAKTTGHNYFYRYFKCFENSRVNLTSGEFAKGNVLINNKVSLEGNDSVGEVKTIAIAQDDQTMAINSRVTNRGLRTRGNILQHGVILDQAKLVFNGIGQIVKGARGADSQQENRVLMLSKKSRGDANPILLIDENDVTAGHAASVGRIDKQQLYYLTSRGLSENIAKRMIIKGFLESVITVIESDRTKKMLRSVIERSLGIDN